MVSHSSQGNVDGVVVMAYGTPASLDDVEAYYTHIRRGRAPEAHLLAELRGRYEALGGTSPLREITNAQAAAIASTLRESRPVTVAIGLKHAEPFIEDAVAQLVADGVNRIVGVVLAPHYSRGSIGEYGGRLATAAEQSGISAVTTVAQWADLPAWETFQTQAVVDGLAGLPEKTKVLFTAHSLPERVLVDDPYPEQLSASAARIASAAGLDRWAGWSVAWQSAGRTADPWRGPDILAVLDDLADTGRADGVLVCPQGFTADHLEVLYDLDDQAASRARALGLAFARTRSINADDAVLRALAQRVLEHFDQLA